MRFSSAPRSGVASRRVRPVAALVLALALPPLLGGCETVSLEGVTPTLEDDAPLSREVGAALAERPELARFDLNVKSLDEDTIRLSGFVDNDSQRVAAEQAAYRVPGVKSVVNTIFLY